MRTRILLIALVVLTTSALAGAGEMKQGSMFWGGWFGASFGTVDYVELSPSLGFYPVEKLATGLRLTYRYRNDGRYSPSLSSSDYGGGVFARYHFVPFLFVQGEYDYLSYEYYTIGGRKERTSDDALLGGGGFSQPLGDHAVLHFTGLYDFFYDDDDPYRAYDSPWVFRVGVGVGF